jgi:hypothetical protein
LLQRLCVAGRYPDKAERLRPWSVRRFPTLSGINIAKFLADAQGAKSTLSPEWLP